MHDRHQTIKLTCTPYVYRAFVVRLSYFCRTFYVLQICKLFYQTEFHRSPALSSTEPDMRSERETDDFMALETAKDLSRKTDTSNLSKHVFRFAARHSILSIFASRHLSSPGLLRKQEENRLRTCLGTRSTQMKHAFL